MKNRLLFLLLIISASAQAMNPPRKRAREERRETVAQTLNRIEHDVVQQIDREAASAEISLKERLLNARILQQQTLQPEFGFSEQERQDVKGHLDWLSALQRIHFPQSIPAAFMPQENPEEKNEMAEQPAASKKHRIDSSDSL
jgi:hypothetical protein